MMRWIIVSFSLFAFLPTLSEASKCAGIFEQFSEVKKVKSDVGRVQVLRSGRDAEEIAPLQQAIEELFSEGGVADRLGIKLPPHVIEFVSSHDIAVLASLGRHAIGHALEGAALVGSLSQVRGVMEFVTPGCPTCRSYYKDTTGFVEQVSILMHVIGHNDFAVNSLMNRMRNEDQIARSMELYHEFEAIKEKHGHAEVSRFFHYLKSLDYLQDLHRGTFDPPSEFGAPPPPGSKRSAYPTRSVLQSMVNNLPRNAPEWQRDVLSLYERMSRVFGYMANQKIMNEGWATLMQHILVEHSRWQHSGDIISFASLFAGVAGSPKYRDPQGRDMGWNPYWLGLECWKRVRARFEEENAGLDKLEMDRKFIQHAHKLIEELSDVQFIRYALDEKWVTRYGLFLSRPTRPGEEKDIDEQPEQGKTHQYVVVTDDPARIVDKIALEAADKRMMIPVISKESESGLGRNVVDLKQEDFLGIPLEPHSAVQTLYVLAQVYQKPVSLRCRIAYEEVEEIPPEYAMFAAMMGQMGMMEKEVRSQEVRLEVDVDGKVRAFKAEASDGESGQRAEVSLDSLKDELQSSVEVLKTDLWTSYPTQEQAARPISFVSSEVREEIVEHIAQQVASFSSHAPTAAKAISEYRSMVQERMDRILKLLMQGNTPHRITAQGLLLDVMPIVPSFKYDHNTWQQLLDKGEPSPIDPSFSRSLGDMRLLLASSNKDIDTDLGQGGGRRKGDRFWGPPPEGGQGKGNGNGNGKPGEPKPGEPGEDPGPGAGDQPGRSVLIPFDKLGKFLEEQIELPNLRRLKGKEPKGGDILMGGVHKPEGELLYDRMMGEILVLGKLSLQKKGIAEPTHEQMMREGMRLIGPDDHVVRDRHPDPDPEINAVIVFKMDKSGSMAGRPFELAREFSYILKTLLRQRYKKVELRFIGFTNEAREEKEDTFFEEFMNGGTAYSAGIELTGKILEKYPQEAWDRFVFTVGDFDCMNAERSAAQYKELIETLQFAGFIYTPNSWGGNRIPMIYEEMGALVGPDHKVGRAILSDETGGSFPALKKVFEKKD